MDSVIVGNFLGDQALASVGATTAIFELIVGFALGIGAGLSIIVARYYGARNYQMVKRATAASLIIGLIISLMIMVIGHFGLKPLLKGLNTPAEILTRPLTISILF
nr:MATE family efflux transporter [Eremococcus coleocola]